MKSVIAIDLGTSNTVVCYQRAPSTPQVVIEIDGRSSIPSVIRMDQSGTVGEAFGLNALNEIEKYPDRTFREFKLDLGAENVSPEVESRTLEFLILLRKAIELQQFGNASLLENKFTVIVGLPADWLQFRERFKGLFSRSGYPDVMMVPEPLAASIFHLDMLDDLRMNKDLSVIVVDCGAGTTDLSLVDWKCTSTFPIPRTLGGFAVAGSHFDYAIAAYFKTKFELNVSLDYLSLLAKEAKEYLSEKERFDSTFFDPEGTQSIRISINRTQMREACGSVWSDFSDKVNGCIERNKISRGAIDHVILVGGMSLCPLFVDAVQKTLALSSPKKVVVSGQPTNAVALGLAGSQYKIPEIADKLGSKIRDVIEGSHHGESLKSQVKALLLHQNTKERFESAIARAIDEAWPDVSIKKLLGNMCHLTKDGRKEAIAKSKSGVAISKSMEAHLGKEIEQILRKVENLVDKHVKQAVKGAIEEIGDLGKIYDVLTRANQTQNENATDDLSSDMFKNLMGSLIAAVTTIISLLMVSTTQTLLFFITISVLSPVAIAAAIIAALGVVFFGKKLLSPKQRITKKLVTKLTELPKGCDLNSPKAKDTLYANIWKPTGENGEEGQGVEYLLDHLFDLLWEGTPLPGMKPEDLNQKPLRDEFISLMNGNNNFR